MDPITTALVAAAGAAAKDTLSVLAKQAFQTLKEAVVARFSAQPAVKGAVETLENDPSSPQLQAYLHEKLKEADAPSHADLVRQANDLLALLAKENALPRETYQAVQTGRGGLAQGRGAVAAGAGGVAVGGSVTLSGDGHAFGVGNTVHFHKTTTTTGASLAELTAFLHQARASLQSAGLDAATHQTIESDLAAVEKEAKDTHPSREIIEPTLNKITATLTKAGRLGASVAGCVEAVKKIAEWAGSLPW
jgi:hypothetical protein